jgi:hypothetical protein
MKVEYCGKHNEASVTFLDFSNCIVNNKQMNKYFCYKETNSEVIWHFLYFMIKILTVFKYISEPVATISQVYYLTFTRIYCSTCFGRPHAHHQELNNCNSCLWFYRWSVVLAVLLVVVGLAGPYTTNSTAATTLQRQNQRLLLQLLSF